MSRRARKGATGCPEQGDKRIAASSKTARNGQNSILEHHVLPLLLHHRSICKDQKLFCNLLCTSKAMQAAVTLHCAGQLHVHAFATTKSKKAVHKRFTAWLKRHAAAVQVLDLELGNYGKKESAAEAAVAAALQKAAAASAAPGLQIRSFSAEPASPSVHVLLQQLPANTLTRLDLVFEPGSQPPAATITGLTALRELRLEGGGDSALKGCTALTNLQTLFVTPLNKVNKLQRVPPQLRELNFGVTRQQQQLQQQLHEGQLRGRQKRRKVAKQQLLQLGHATALTKLITAGCFGERGVYDVQEDAVLPPNLQYLVVRDVPLVKPLLQLQQLRRLHMSNSTTSADELQQLCTALTQLSEVKLSYLGRYNLAEDEILAVDSAAAAWPLLPLSSLTVQGRNDQQMSAASVQQLGRVTGLTRLELLKIKQFWATAEQLGAALQQLTTLRSLRLGGRHMLKQAGSSNSGRRWRWGRFPDYDYDDSSDDDSDSDCDEEVEVRRQQVRAVFSGIASLTGLRKLNTYSWCANGLFRGTMLDGLAPQLQQLGLEKAALQDEDVQAIAVKFTQLRRLNLAENSKLTDAALSALLQLPSLAILSVQDTAVTRPALQQLKADMKRLKAVRPGSSLFDNLPLDVLPKCDLGDEARRLVREFTETEDREMLGSSSCCSSEDDSD